MRARAELSEAERYENNLASQLARRTTQQQVYQQQIAEQAVQNVQQQAAEADQRPKSGPKRIVGSCKMAMKR